MRALGVQRIPVTQLRANPANVRSDLGDLSELTASIKGQGVMQPLIVTRRPTPAGTVYVLVDGHRRAAAAQAAGVQDLSCLVIEQQSAEQETASMLAVAMHRGLEPMDQARAFRKLRDAGWSTMQIAHRTGHSTGTIRDRLALLELPAQAQRMVEQKEVTLGAAKDLTRQLRRSPSGSARTAGPKSTYFDKHHPAADDARDRCTPAHREHRRLVGANACGQCWEAAILNRAGATP